MGPSLTAPDAAPAASATPLRRLLRVVSMVRYRFFLYAGLLPYLLGAAWAWGVANTFDAAAFSAGIVIVIAACLVAAFYPARKAAGVEPWVALRIE